MKRFLLPVCIISLLLLGACGGSSSSSTGISISISPTSATVALSATEQFTATVKDATDTGVIWQVNGVTGGNASYGYISGSGLYTAPATAPSSPTVTITAISAASSGKTASATVTVAAAVSISPTSTSVVAAQTAQFSASVNFSSNTRVSWQVNGIAGGNSTVGTINSNGLYTAPNAPPTPSTVTVTAVASADSTRTASATVTVTAAPIVISPSSATIGAAGQQAFTATLLSATIQPTWSVSCSSSIAGACGSITTGGTYTAPVTPPPGGTATITATSGSSNPSTGTAVATIQFGNASLAGRYVYTTSDNVGHNAPSQAGTLVFDGSGHITGGVVDSTDAPGTTATVTGSTYQVGTDGRGTAVLQTSAASYNLQFVLVSNAQGFVFRTDSASNHAGGTIELQQANLTALNGSYALSLSGITADSSAALLNEAGSLILSSAGGMTGGILDTDKALALQTAAITGGSWTALSSAGRGTLTATTALGSQKFAYYPVDSAHAKLVPIDGSSIALGELYAQLQGPFSAATLKASYAFSVAGAKNGVLSGTVGVFSLDGSSVVTNQQFDGISQTVFDFNPGTYTVTDNVSGRTTLAWTADAGAKIQYVAYPRADGGLVLLQTDGRYMGSGLALPQASLSVSNFFSLQGSFAMALGGSELSAPASAERIVGQLSASTSPTLSGTIDGTTVGQGTSFTLNLLTSNLTAQRYVLGIPSAALNGETIIAYRISDNQAFLIISDSTRAMTGIFKRQY